MELPKLQVDLLQHLASASGPVRIQDLAAALGQDQSPVAAAVTELAQREFAAVQEQPFEELSLGKDGEATVGKPLPERVIVGVLIAQGGRCKVTDVPAHCTLDQSAVGQSLRFLNQRGWATKEG
ncbi:MAG: hypothetical protein ACKVS9_10600, partial [Phycisphaerae bacterium]